MNFKSLLYGLLTLAVVAMIIAIPSMYYRASYGHAKRFRIVTDGRFYRSGQFTAGGLQEIIDTYNIKTVINFQHENPDPEIPQEWLGKKKYKESELCLAKGVRYIQLDAFELVNEGEKRRPIPVDQFLNIMDDPTVYPVLIHCMAGLHRTGRLTAVYRMEYEGWSKERAMQEMKSNGYGNFMCTDVDPYFVQYVREYQPKIRNATAPAPNIDIRPTAANVISNNPQPQTQQQPQPQPKNNQP